MARRHHEAKEAAQFRNDGMRQSAGGSSAVTGPEAGEGQEVVHGKTTAPGGSVGHLSVTLFFTLLLGQQQGKCRGTYPGMRIFSGRLSHRARANIGESKTDGVLGRGGSSVVGLEASDGEAEGLKAATWL
ncbi:hypothetical protein L249_6758 [Ophiocordyceps polyrhachis-furcata BCC 54312]|uniref:Uncharacterized protein n=1 Tax=Ophiocordyceps polyrhachis-furcata BCC 54312 TaxID=1330021 RepID=A0A367LLP8_9HYPO|nr:hypothetical protein L249_6758 [Ophiocordyceps polyrhachis-furcata BCC 54312]